MNTAGRGEKALKAGAAYVISNIIVKAVYAITTPFFVRMMSTEQYGIVSMFNSWSALLLPFFSLQLGYSVGRAKIDYSEKIENYLGSMMLLSAMISGLIVIGSMIFINPIMRFLELNKLETTMLIIYLISMPAIEYHQGLFKYRYQYKQNVFIAWYTILGTTILSFVLMCNISGEMDELRIIGLTVPSVILSIFLWVGELYKKNVKINVSFWRYGCILSGPLIIHQLSLHVLSQSDRIFITKNCGKESVGLYSLCYTIGLLLSVITSAISEAWLPWFHDTVFEGNYEIVKKKVKPLVLLGAYLGLATVALAPELILLWGGTKYLPGLMCIAPVTLGIVCRFIYGHYVNIEMHLKKTHFISTGTIIAAFINIVLNWIFIPKYGYLAAAYTTFASYFVLLVMHFFITRYILKFKLYDDWFMFGMMLLVSIITWIITITYRNNGLRYIVIGVGFISFIVAFHNYIGNIWVIINKMLKRGKMNN